MFENYKLKKLMYNLGSVEEKDNCIVCEVENDKLSKECADGLLILDTRQLKEKYGITKDILFIIKNYNFRDGLFLITDASVNFNNCTFHDDIYVKTANNLVFDDNQYMNDTDTYKHSDRFIDISHVNNVIFMNEMMKNSSSDNQVSMKVEANNIELYNSTIYNDEINSANLQAKKITLDNTTISGYSSFIKAPLLFMDEYSSIHPHTSLIIDTNTELDEDAISADKIILNGLRVDIKRTHSIKK